MRKKYIFFSGLSLTILVLICIGVSYSLWNISNTQDKINTVMTRCFDITYSSDNNNINLSNTYPISDEKGLSLTPYTFTITNKCDINAYYKINLETLNNSNIDNNFMKVSLNESSPKKVSMYESTDKILNNSKISNNLLTGYLPVGGTEEFNLRVWMDYDTTIDDIKNDGTDKWVGKVVVVSSPVNEDEIANACRDKGGDLVDSGECRKYYVKVNNFIQNGNFANGINGWNQFRGKFISYDSTTNLLKMSNSNPNNPEFVGIYQAPTVLSVVNHNYYVTVSLMPKDESRHFYIGIENFWRPLGEIQGQVNNKNWNNYSDILKYDENIKNQTFQAYVIYILAINGEQVIEFYVKNLNYIDLTLMFGEGNEPNKEWCDKYLTNYYEYNSKGTLMPIKDIGEPLKTSYYDKIDMKNYN